MFGECELSVPPLRVLTTLELSKPRLNMPQLVAFLYPLLESQIRDSSGNGSERPG